MKRRSFVTSLPLVAGVLAAESPTAARAQDAEPTVFAGGSSFASQVAQLEHLTGGRLGVCAFVAGSDGFMGYRERERFPMCSTFKALLVATVLARVDGRAEHLDRAITFSKRDLLAYAPVTSAHVDAGRMTVRDLCAAALEQSDNTAANLLLAAIGGPAAVTRFARSLGDRTTRLDRNEPSLNSALPGDPRDTTSPFAMARTLERIALQNALRPSSKQLLQQWLIATTTGANRLRAGVPKTWRVGDKTGTGERGATNDIAIFWPRERRPILVTAYFVESRASLDAREATLRAVGGLVAKAFGAAS